MIHGFLARLDPRAKLLVLVAFLVLYFLPLPLLYLGVYLAVAALLLFLAAGWEGLLRTLRTVLLFLILILLLTPPFFQGGKVLLAPLGVPLVTTKGLAEAVRLAIRFTGITLAFSTFIRTTLPEELISAFRSLGLPFSAALTLTLVVRTIPQITALYHNVVDAHRLRRGGTEAGAAKGGRHDHRGRFRRLIPELTSVLVQAVRGIPTLAMVLESRGVGRKNPRSRYLEPKAGARLLADLALSLLFVLLLGGCAFLLYRTL